MSGEIDIVPIKGIPGYFISKSGDVFSTKGLKWKKLKFYYHLNGYRFIQLRKDGKYVYRSQHRLLAEHFLSTWDPKLFVNHKNGIKDDNRLENLEMVTMSENMLHAQNTGLWKNKGIENRSSCLSEEDIQLIRYLCDKGIQQKAIGQAFNLEQANISAIYTRKTYKSVPEKNLNEDI